MTCAENTIEPLIVTKYVSCRLSCTGHVEITEETTGLAGVDHGTH